MSELIGIGERGGVDVYDDLIALSGRAGINAVVQRGLGDDSQRIRLLLCKRRGVFDSEGLRHRFTARLERASHAANYDTGVWRAGAAVGLALARGEVFPRKRDGV